MITFTIALLILIGGYVVYGKFVAKFFGSDDSRPVPAKTMADGVDYIEMPVWKAYMIQFLNIAGLGPIFGAIMGAKFGTSSYLWIVFGTIFGGAVHDYLAGMVSLRNGGESLPNMVGRFLGDGIRSVFTVFSIILMILVGCVFVSQPAQLLADLTPNSLNLTFWMIVIFLYYLAATLFPIDKIIGNLYPILGAVLLFMAIGIMAAMYVIRPELPEMWNGFGVKYEGNPIFPMMFVSIACGAVSGMHATQSPLMARCLKKESDGRKVFYGAMVSEGIVALVWAAAATAYFHTNGAEGTAAQVAMNITRQWLGPVGGVVAILGVIAAPISSGDTAMRSARLMIADSLHFTQKGISNRLAISIPLFSVTLVALYVSITKSDGFAVVWRYFAWCNQMMSVFTFWALTVYLCKNGKNCLITLIPAVFMTCVETTYVLMAPEWCGLSGAISYPIGIIVALNFLVLLLRWKHRYNMKFPQQTKFYK